MRSVVNLVYLAVYISVSLVQYAHPPSINQLPYAYVWAIASFLYPLCLVLTHTPTGFWKGLLTILLISVVAQAVEAVVYLLGTNGFQHSDTDTVVWLGFYLIGPLASAAIWYPIGYLASRLLLRRKSGGQPRRNLSL